MRVPFTVRDATLFCAVSVIVTVCPATIVTSSEAPGTAPPTQVPPVPQSPVAAELMAAASAG